VVDVLTVERSGAVATLTLERPEKKNALSIELRDAISDALDVLAADEQVSCIVFTGRGEVFSAGFDLREFDRAATDEKYSRALWASSDRYHRTVREFPLPTVAMLNGPAIAGGMDLAVMCDMRIACHETWFAHPEYTFGDVVYAPLRDLLGGAMARELSMTGRRVDADEAYAIRLVNQVVARAELAAATATLTDRICAAPRALLARTKAKALRGAGVVEGGTLDM
jgi:enoyl-CoA hydratase